MHVSEEVCKKTVVVMLMIFISLFSIFVAANKVQELPMYQSSVQKLDDTNDTVVKFCITTLGLSIAITLLPDDLATPLADSLADMQKYFVIILGMVFFEKLVLVEGVPIVFQFVVPFICILYVLYILTKKEILKSLSGKFLGLAIALVLFVPASTFFSNTICANYQKDIDKTIEVVSNQEDAMNDLTTSDEEGQGFFEKATSLLKTAIGSFKDIFENCKKIIEKCITAIAMLIVINCGIPAITFFLLVWFINQLFQFQHIELSRIVKVEGKKSTNEEVEAE